MDTFEAIYSRRAVKHYVSEHVMPEEDLRKLFEAAIQSPTSFNIQHWRFVVVRDKELRKQIRAAGNDQAQMTDASVLIVMTGDVLAWKKDPQRYWRDAPPEVAKLLVDWMGPFHEGRVGVPVLVDLVGFAPVVQRQHPVVAVEASYLHRLARAEVLPDRLVYLAGGVRPLSRHLGGPSLSGVDERVGSSILWS